MAAKKMKAKAKRTPPKKGATSKKAKRRGGKAKGKASGK